MIVIKKENYKLSLRLANSLSLESGENIVEKTIEKKFIMNCMNI